jgi:ABC-type transport system involved in multi-copper enzyme maturation permease subunit
VFITGKVLGALLALAVPLLLPMVLGFLLIPMMGVPMSADSWVRLTLIIVAGLMYLGVFVTLSVAVSAITVRSSSSFLTLLVIWICAVLIIPRASVLIAGRAVEVPSADDVASQEARLNAQLWKEDRDKMSAYTATPGGDAQKMLGEFQKFMADIADARQKKMDELSSRLNEERTNRQIGRERFAFGLARISPSSTFSLAAMTLAGTGLNLKQHFRDAAQAYQTTFAKFITEKTGVNPGGGLVFRVVTSDNEKPRAIDPKELPEFTYVPMTLAGVFPGTVLDFGLLAAFMVVFFAVAFVAFLHYDLR